MISQVPRKNAFQQCPISNFPADHRVAVLAVSTRRQVALYFWWQATSSTRLGTPPFVLLIIGLTLFNFFWGKFLAKATNSAKEHFHVGIDSKHCHACYVQIRKTSFSAQSHPQFISSPNSPRISKLNIILPLGISFFVFEFIHYLFEVNKGGKPVESFVHFALFAAFFPTQIAGPNQAIR